jgi:hypothetical protein
MRPVIDIAEIQSQRGQALRIPHREVQVLRGLGEAKAPTGPEPAAPSSSVFNVVPWWAWPLIVGGVVMLFNNRKR